MSTAGYSCATAFWNTSSVLILASTAAAAALLHSLRHTFVGAHTADNDSACTRYLAAVLLLVV